MDCLSLNFTNKHDDITVVFSQTHSTYIMWILIPILSTTCINNSWNSAEVQHLGRETEGGCKNDYKVIILRSQASEYLSPDDIIISAFYHSQIGKLTIAC